MNMFEKLVKGKMGKIAGNYVKTYIKKQVAAKKQPCPPRRKENTLNYQICFN